MRPSEEGRALALVDGALEARSDEIVRVVPVRVAPPDPARLALGGALRVLRHRLEVQRGQGLWTFGVTSARPGEGKSTTAAQLAAVLAEAQRARVLLVEGCFERPSLARLFGVDVPAGLGFSAQVARRMGGGEASARPWAVLALSPSLHALLEGAADASYPGALYAPLFRVAVEQLGRAYDWVVVDAPSVLGSGDANVVEEAVDGMLLVARSGRSRAGDLRAAVKQLGLRKAVGVVLRDGAARAS
jgi:Mrp family chromosome partitioning ATPase